MDYKTKPTSREELRGIARFVRKLFKCKNKYRFDVMDAFESIPSVIPAVTCLVVEDDEIEGDIPARCVPDFEGHYTIEVKSSIYDGAAEGIGGYRAHILHEICHAILCLLGFTPILDRAFKNNELKPFESMEWQHYLVKEIAYHPEPSLTGNHKPVLHVHEYKRDNFSERKPRLLTKYEYEKYKKYFKGVN